MSLKLNVINVFIYIILVLNLNVFYLVDPSAIPISDICIVIEFIFWCYVSLKYKARIRYSYKNLLVLVIIFALISSFAAYINFSSQPIMLGFRPQRAWLAAVMMYFPITRLLKVGRLTSHGLIQIIGNVSLIYGLIIAAQFLVGLDNLFLYASNNTRYGGLRLYITTTYLVLLLFVNLHGFMRGEKLHFKRILLIVLPAFTVFFVIKTRMRIVALVSATVLMLCSQKFTKRKMIVITSVAVILCVFLGTDAGQDIMSMITGNVSSIEDTSEIRDIGRAFYIESNTENAIKFWFGTGFPNIDWPAAVIGSGASQSIGANDNGIFGLFFYYGFSFIIWAIVLSWKIIYQGLKTRNTGLVFFYIYGLLGSYTLFPCFYVTDISFAILCGIIDNDYENIKKTSMINDEYYIN